MLNDVYFSEFPESRSERLIFKSCNLNYVADIFELRSDELAMRYMDSSRLKSIEDAENFIRENLETYQKQQGIFWAILDKSTQKFTGDFVFWDIDHKHHRAELSHMLKPPFWGKGYIKEVMQVLLPFGFQQLGLHSFEAHVNPENHNSKKVLTKIGFRKEGYLRENYLFDGIYLDSEIYGLLEIDLKH